MPLFLIRIYRYFNDSILSVFKDIVGFFDFRKRETVGDERSGVYPALRYQMQDFLAITTIYTASLEDEIFAIHIWER